MHLKCTRKYTCKHTRKIASKKDHCKFTYKYTSKYSYMYHSQVHSLKCTCTKILSSTPKFIPTSTLPSTLVSTKSVAFYQDTLLACRLWPDRTGFQKKRKKERKRNVSFYQMTTSGVLLWEYSLSQLRSLGEAASPTAGNSKVLNLSWGLKETERMPTWMGSLSSPFLPLIFQLGRKRILGNSMNVDVGRMRKDAND